MSLLDGASAPTDAGVCMCDGGPCFAGFCPSTRCRFEMELGFLCPLSGHTCRVIGDEAWCVPACLEVTCPAGAVCDSRTGTCGALDCDAQRVCPMGARCVMNRCEPVDDGGVGDGGVGDGGAPVNAAAGCGCHTARRDAASRAALLMLGLCAVVGRRASLRRRRTRGAQSP